MPGRRPARHSIAHRSQIDYGGDTGKVLHQNAAGSKCDLAGRFVALVPIRQGHNVFAFYLFTIFGAQQVFEQDAKRIGQVRGRNTLFIQSINAVDLIIRLPTRRLERLPKLLLDMMASSPNRTLLV